MKTGLVIDGESINDVGFTLGIGVTYNRDSLM
jgi:hypothetical protein